MKKSVVILLICIVGVFSLHFEILHLQTQQQKQAYLESLLKIEEQLASNVKDLKKAVEENNNKLSRFDGYQTLQTRFLQDALEIERNKTQDMESTMILPLTLKKWECKNITDEEAEKINKQIGETQAKVTNLENLMKNQKSCLRNDEMLKLIEYLKDYLYKLQMQLSNKCPPQNTPPKYYYVPNDQGNVFYGNKSKEQIEKELQDKIRQGYTIVSCPKQTPYPQNGKCIACPSGSFFDIADGFCKTCPVGYKFNHEKKICVKLTFNSNPGAATNYEGNPPAMSSAIGTCPNQLPFFNGDQCIACIFPSYFNYNTLKCQSCAEGKFFNIKTRMCQQMKFNSYLPQGANFCGNPPQYVSQEGTCTAQAPYFNGHQCTSCALPSFFSFDTLQCSSCPDGKMMNKATCLCEGKKFNSYIPQGSNFCCGTTPQNNPQYESCPKQMPYFNGYQCIACELPSYFNIGTLKCVQCPMNKSFNKQTQTCDYVQYNSYFPEGGNYCCGKPYNYRYQMCPQQIPYFNGVKCISCTLPYYFNIQYKACVLCPDGQAFSTKIGKCEYLKYLEPHYVPFPSANSQNYYGEPPSVDSRYQNIKHCPEDKPFSNGGSCISCSFPSYFNYASGLCEMCNPNYKFDLNMKKCIHQDTSKYNSNMVAIDNFKGRLPAYNSSLSSCDESRPFFNGQECVECNYPKFVDFTLYQCTNCDSDAMEFDKFSRDCVYKNPAYYSDLDSKNIFFNGDWDSAKRRIDDQKSSYSQKCPSHQPFYNAKTNSCISCLDQYPLFDLKYNRCIKCSGNSSYNEEKKICELPGGVPATVERMIMNTVPWI